MLFSSVAGVWRPLSPGASLQLQLGLGPALIAHAGSGESLMARQVDVGGVATAGARIALSRRLGLGVDVYDYRFTSRFDSFAFDPGNGTYRYPAASVRRSEWLILPGLQLRF